MKITTPRLIRWAGLSSMVAGIIFAVILPIQPPDGLASVITRSFIIITSVCPLDTHQTSYFSIKETIK